LPTQVRGTIQYVPKPREFRKGNNIIKYYSIKVNDEYYSTGTKFPPAEGTLVEFEAEQNPKGFWDVTKAGLKVVEAGAPTQAVAAQAVTAASKAHMSKDDYWRRKEERDIPREDRIDLHGCRNSAIAMVTLLLTPVQTAEGVVNLVKLPAQAKRVEFVEKLVEQYTEQFRAANNKKNEANNGSIEAPSEVSADRPVGTPDPNDPVWDA
jgi:hypothetical protein